MRPRPDLAEGLSERIRSGVGIYSTRRIDMSDSREVPILTSRSGTLTANHKMSWHSPALYASLTHCSTRPLISYFLKQRGMISVFNSAIPTRALKQTTGTVQSRQAQRFPELQRECL